MNNNVRLGVEIVILVIAIFALGLYVTQQQDLATATSSLDDANATVTALSAENESQSSDIADLEQEVADAQTAAESMEATAMADIDMVNAQVADVQAEATEQADMAATAMADVEAAQAEAQAQADAAATAMADAETANAQIADAQAEAQTQADMAATAMADAEAAAQQVADLQATIDAMNAATPEPEATEAPAVEETEEVTMEETEAPEMTEVVGFNTDAFSMALDASYTVFNLTGDDREASVTAIVAADADLGARITRETAHDYAAWQGVGEYVLVNQQGAPAGITSIADIADVAFRRADSSEVVTLGENEAARGMFGDSEVRYIVLDAGSLWVITFHSADVAGNLEAFDAAVASFNAVEPPAEEE